MTQNRSEEIFLTNFVDIQNNEKVYILSENTWIHIFVGENTHKLIWIDFLTYSHFLFYIRINKNIAYNVSKFTKINISHCLTKKY